MGTTISGATGIDKVQDGTIVNADINSSAAIANSKLVGAGGITDISKWSVDAYTTSSTIDPISSGWSGTTIKGSAMTQSSGVFTFPSTGYWRIDIQGTFFMSNTSALNIENVAIQCFKSTDGGSSWGSEHIISAHSNMDSPGDDWWRTQVGQSVVVDITNTANDKIKFLSMIYGSTAVYHHFGGVNGGFIFTRLGDT